MITGALGSRFALTGTNLATGYTASAVMNAWRGSRVRFFVHSVRSAGSGATTTTIKLQMRYNDGTVTTTYVDLPSNLDDVIGAAQPKGSTREIEHAFTTSANATTDNTFYLDSPAALLDVTINVKVNSAGQSGDSTTVYVAAS